MMHFDDISDDEIRIIGDSSAPKSTPAPKSAPMPAPTFAKRKPSIFRRWWFWAALIVLLVVSLLTLWSIISQRSSAHHAVPEEQYDFVDATPAPISPTLENDAPSNVLVRDTVINDVPLCILTPVNAVPELMLGIPDTTDESLVLGLQAADIRADNGGIVGAFVLKGELLSRGVAKKGFCAILDGKIQLGMAQSTPLFEEATDKDGYFFRQYPLVSNGRMVENKPKNKAVRHALCELEGRVVVVSSLDNESFHDFAQSLVDLGVQNAIALVGADAYGFFRAQETGFSSWGTDVHRWKDAENVNFVVWKCL